MKKIHLIVLFLMLASLSLVAQPPGGGRGMQMSAEDVEENARNTAGTLELDETQTNKFVAIQLDFYNRMQIERQKMRNAEQAPSREEMREKMMNMRDERDKQIKEVMTEEQFKKFQELQEQRRDEMRQRREQDQPEERSQRGRGRG